MVVDLPQPLEPRKPKISPRSIVKFTALTAVNFPKRRVRFLATMAGSASVSTRGGMVSRRAEPRFSSGNRATKVSSRFWVPVLCLSSSGVPVARIRPASIAISQSKRSASSMYAVETSTLIPGRPARMLSISVQNCCRESGSTPVVGSSRISRSGS